MRVSLVVDSATLTQLKSACRMANAIKLPKPRVGLDGPECFNLAFDPLTPGDAERVIAAMNLGFPA